MFIDDFTGFYWNGHHTSEWDIKVVTSGSRYDSRFLSDMNNNLTDIPGGDGQYFYNTTYGPKKWTCNIAFDRITEVDKREIENWLSSKELSDFIFDEVPYKAYSCKLENRPSITWLCFDEPKTTGSKKEPRIYKGEGTLNFIAPYPYAHNARKLNDDGTVGQSLKYLDEIEFIKNKNKGKKYNYNVGSTDTLVIHNNKSIIDLNVIEGNLFQEFDMYSDEEIEENFGKEYPFYSGTFFNGPNLEESKYLKIIFEDNNVGVDDGVHTALTDSNAWCIFNIPSSLEEINFRKLGDKADKIIYDKETGNYKLYKIIEELILSPVEKENTIKYTITADKKENSQADELEVDLESININVEIENKENIYDLNENTVLSSNYYKNDSVSFNPDSEEGFIKKGKFAITNKQEDEGIINAITLTFNGNFFKDYLGVPYLRESTLIDPLEEFKKCFIFNEESGKFNSDDNKLKEFFENPLNFIENPESPFNGEIKLLIPLNNPNNVIDMIVTLDSEGDDDKSNLYSLNLRRNIMFSSNWYPAPELENGMVLTDKIEIIEYPVLYENLDEWQRASGMKRNSYKDFTYINTESENNEIVNRIDYYGSTIEYDKPCVVSSLMTNGNQGAMFYFPVYNAGDIPSPITLRFDFMERIDGNSQYWGGTMWGDYKYHIVLQRVENFYDYDPRLENVNLTIDVNNILDLQPHKKYLVRYQDNWVDLYFQEINSDGQTPQLKFIDAYGNIVNTELNISIKQYLSENTTRNFHLEKFFTISFNPSEGNDSIRNLLNYYVTSSNYRSSIQFNTERQSVEWIIEALDTSGNLNTEVKPIIIPANFMLTGGEIFTIPPKVDNLQIVMYTDINGRFYNLNKECCFIEYPYLYY